MKMKKPVRMPLRRVPPRPKAPGAPLRARAAAVEEDYEEEEEDYEAGEEPNMKFSHALIVVLVLHLVAVGGVFGFNWMKSRQAPEGKAATTAATAPAATTETAAEAAKAAAPATIAGWTGKTHTVGAGDTLTRIATVHGVTIEAIEKENGITTYSMIRVGQVLKIPGSEKTTVKKTETSKPATDTANTAAKQAFIATKTDAPKAEKPEVVPVKATVISAVPKTKATETAAKPVVEKAETSKPAAEAASGDVYVVAKGDNPYSIAKKLHVSYNELLAVNGIKDATKIQIGQKLKIPKK